MQASSLLTGEMMHKLKLCHMDSTGASVLISCDLRAETLPGHTHILSDVCKHILPLVVHAQSLSLLLQLCLQGDKQCLLAFDLPKTIQCILTHSFPP